jgi:amino acid adenylation domain-containing protein
MSELPRLRCILMGDQSRLIQCGNILLEKGHQILGVISAEPAIQSWAKGKSLPQILPSAELARLLGREPFDLFLSIDNFSIVPNEVLGLPRKFAINFHDAPLPRHAGVNATNWALINQEKIHGVTWHVMLDRVDAGDILKQVLFPVSARETALTLNAKCYEKSIESFAELLDELVEDRVKPITQNLENRTYYGRWKRPSADCTIDWNCSAEEIDALFRGLDFGSYPNPLGLPKLYLGDRAVIVKGIEVMESKPPVAPGTITLVADERVQVATKTREVALHGFISFEGDLLCPAVFLAESGLRHGDQLPRLEREQVDSITRIHSELCRHENFWMERLRSLEPLQIPYAKRRVSRSGSIRYLEVRLTLPERAPVWRECSESLGDLALTALALILYRIGNKESFDVNYRDVSLAKKLSGTEVFFASHVPLRVTGDPEQRFSDFSRAILKEIKTASARGSYARDLVFRHPALREAFRLSRGRGLPVALERVDRLSDYRPQCDADFVAIIPDDGRECLWLYDEEVLDEAAIGRMWEQFLVLWSELAAGHDRFLDEYSILPERESRMLLEDWCGAGEEYPQVTCLHQLFEAQVERTPDAEALRFQNEPLTYRELNRKANQIANRLRALGAGPETLVGLFVERSLDIVVGILGILKSGGAYLPLDPAYPRDRLAFMMEDTQAPLVLTQESLADRLPRQAAHILCLDGPDLEPASDGTSSSKNPDSGAKPGNPAYVIYTSGSTGKPKGVIVSHGNVTRLFEATNSWFHFGRKDVWTLFHSYAFDFSVWEMWGALLYGGRLVVVPYEVSRSPKAFYKLLVREGVTILNQTPSAFLQLIQAEQSIEPEGDLALRFVIFGGEALELPSLKPWIERHGDTTPQLVNMYGITETTVHVTYRPIKAEDVRSGRGSVIGQPIPDLRLYVLDRNRRPVPIGVPGELYVGGAGLARGYLNRPELTEEHFVLDPFSRRPGARLYRTGDLIRYLPERDLEYLGRTDQQVQVRGFRVELGEIEAVLTEHEKVARAVVVFREERPGDMRLVAYFVPAPGPAVTITELRQHLRMKLPDYMIPQHFVRLDALPMTPSGKVDRRALPVPQEDRRTEEGYVAPRSRVEKVIAGIWEELLHVMNIGTHDSFFELGGHSLLLVEMLSRLNKSFDRELSIVDLFRHPTVSALAKFLTQEEDTGVPLTLAYERVEKQKESLRRRKKMASKRERR